MHKHITIIPICTDENWLLDTIKCIKICISHNGSMAQKDQASADALHIENAVTIIREIFQSIFIQ